MMTGLGLETLTAEGDADALHRLLHHAFATDLESIRGWLLAAGHENVRVVKRDGEVLGGMLQIPMGQVFGGRVVPMYGVAGVAVRPDVLRRGVCTWMMSSWLREVAERGIATASLYASNHLLYRGVGFEPAGSAFSAELRPDQVPFTERELEVRQLDRERDRELYRDLYRHVFREHAGFLDRGPYIWPRLDDVRFGVGAFGVGFVNEEGEAEGYVWYRKRTTGGGRHDVQVTDLAASTARGWRRVWTFLGDLGTMVEKLSVPTSPTDPFYLIHPNPQFTLTLFENWHLRIVDPTRAVAARGFAPVASGTVDLDLEDGVLVGGRYRLTVAGGEGRLEPGGSGAVHLDTRAFAAIFSGFATPRSFARRGLLSGPDADLERLAGLFAGPTPWMRDMF